ncbi:PE-PGRS family protein [Streptomyces sp. NPDC006602]|uniref:PE-PGRS family protein n=1 Tax=Streptomyces sp. NPDC006602 TaxID=3364751 RepID=UPI0036A23981
MTSAHEELFDRLRRAGLEIAGEWRVEDVLSPRAAWRRVIGFETEPTATVRTDRPDLVDSVNREWHRLASGAGVLDGDGVFLIAVADNSSRGAGRPWTRVRLTTEWDLAGVLGERPGQPEFVTLALDGDALVAATVEEYDVWLIAEERLKERQEAEAEAAAGRRTPRERAAVWASLFEGPGPTEDLLDAWAGGLARNAATPADIRARLLDRCTYVLYRPLPADVLDAALAHPDWNVRSMAAEYQPDITPEQRARMILDAQDSRQRWLLTLVAVERRAELPEDICRRLAADPSDRIRAEVSGIVNLPADVAVALAADPEPAVRVAACRVAWPHLDQRGREALLADPDSEVRSVALLARHRDHPLPRSVFEAANLEAHEWQTLHLERDLAEHLARHGEPDDRIALAANPHLDPDLVALLAEDPDRNVRRTVSVRADLTEEQRARIPIDFDLSSRPHTLEWVRALHDDEDAMRRLAASSHPLVRRSVARARRLPPDVVARLARDEDRIVQLFLAESCDDAPADMLMAVWQWWTGSLTFPDRPHGHPNFPRHDLLRYADDPNRSCGLNGSESVQPRAPNGLGRAGPRRTRPRGGDTHPVRGPGPGGQFPPRPGQIGTARGGGEALDHPLVEQGPRTLTPYPVSQVARPR